MLLELTSDQEFFRATTAGRMSSSAQLFVGGTSGFVRNVNSPSTER